jgi:hypothetical protein
VPLPTRCRVISAGNGQLNLALASHFNGQSRRNPSAAGNLVVPNPGGPQTKHFGEGAHWHPLCWHPLPRAKSQRSGPCNRARSSRNGRRNHPGTSDEIESECLATSSRLRERLPSKAALGVDPRTRWFRARIRPFPLYRPTACSVTWRRGPPPLRQGRFGIAGDVGVAGHREVSPDPRLICNSVLIRNSVAWIGYAGISGPLMVNLDS